MQSASTALCIFVALAAGGANVDAQAVALGQYAVQAKLLTIPDSEADDLPQFGAIAETDFSTAAQRPQTQLRSFPEVSAPLAETAKISLSEPLTLPSGQKREVGPTLDIHALADGRFHVNYHNVAFLGYNEPGAIHPHFQNRNVGRTIQPTTASEQAYSLIDVTPHSDLPLLYDAGGRQLASAADAHKRLLLFVKITRG